MNMLKVAKFGGSSVAGAEQFRKVKSIVEADPDRRIIVVSAAGKRNREDHKITDLLYLCNAHRTYGVSCEEIRDQDGQKLESPDQKDNAVSVKIQREESDQAFCAGLRRSHMLSVGMF